jgi:UDP-GlcNAc3NAcA epimerase
MKKIVTIVGARPQFVKAAVVSRALKFESGVQEILLHTGQHYDATMSDIFFSELEIPKPAYNLNVGSGRHGVQTGDMLRGIENILLSEKADGVLVYGDTNSTLAGALAAAKLNIPVAHVEAGLRSYNRRMPEEINRVMTDHLSQYLFAPTQQAVQNLQAENVTGQIIRTGDVMYDAVLFYREKIKAMSFQFSCPVEKPFVLATIHRAENTDQPERLLDIFNALVSLSQSFPIIIPLHPRTRKMLQEAGWKNSATQLHLIQPLGYLEMLRLQQLCALVITDSGGLQKEAYCMMKRSVVLRNETEWTELVEAGFNTLCPDTKNLPALVRQYFGQLLPQHTNVYGDGQAATKIAQFLRNIL